MINPQELDPSTLPWLPLEDKSAFPRQPAIYFAIDSLGAIQYIGRSIDPKQRWSGHHRYDQLKAIGNIRVAFFCVDTPELLPQIEEALISWFNPPLNGYDFLALRQTDRSGFAAGTRIKIFLREVRKKKGVSQKRLAEAIGMSLQNVQNIEYGVAKSIPLDTLDKLCSALGCQVGDLLVWVPEGSND